MSLKIVDEFSNTTYSLTEVTPKFNSKDLGECCMMSLSVRKSDDYSAILLIQIKDD